MAMTKAEKERIERLERSVRMARALRWPDYHTPDPMTREEIEVSKVDGGMRYGNIQRVAFGWFANSYSIKVSKGCSDGVAQGERDVTTTQGMGRMFRTEVEAWRTIRIELTEKYSEILADIDAHIADAES